MSVLFFSCNKHALGRFALWISILLAILLPLHVYSATTTPPAEGVLNPSQQAWVKAHRIVRIAPNPNFAPIDTLDSDGRQRGLSADYLKLIAARSGLEFQIVRIGSLSSALAALREHRIDMLTGAPVNPADIDYALFSTPYLRLPGAIFARNNDAAAPSTLKELTGRNIAVVSATAWQNILEEQTPSASLHSYPTPIKALTALAEGQVDAYVGDAITTESALTHIPLKDRISLQGQLGIELSISFMMRNDQTELQSIIDSVLNNISLSEEKTLRERWFKTSEMSVSHNNTLTIDVPGSHSEAIAAAKKALLQVTHLSAEEVQQAQTLLNEAAADEERADQLLMQRKAAHKEAGNIDTEIRQIEALLSQDRTADILAWRSNLPERADVEESEVMLAQERAKLAEVRTMAATLKAELDVQLTRPAQIRDKLAEAHAELERLSNQTEADITVPILRTIHHLRLLAGQRITLAEIAKLEEENHSYDPRLKLLTLRLRAQQRATTETDQRVQALEDLLLARTNALASTLNERLQNERSALTGDLLLLDNTAEANNLLGQAFSIAVQRMGTLDHLRREYSELDATTQQALARTKKRIDIGGVTEAVGLALLSERRKLRSLPLLYRELAELDTEQVQARIRLLDLHEQEQALEDVGAEVERNLARLPELSGATENTLRQGLYRLLATRAEVLPRLITTQTRLVATLTDTVEELRSLAQTTAELTELLDARLLWTPSHTSVNRAWLQQISQGFSEVIQPQRWLGSLRLGISELGQRPLLGISALLIMAILVLARIRLPHYLEALATPMRRIRTDRYRLTGQALLISLIAALPLPFLFWCLGQLWQHAAAINYQFSDSLGIAFNRLVIPAFTLSFLYALTTEKGLAHYHFRWTRQRREALRNLARSLTVILLPCQFFLVVIMLWGNDSVSGSVGRILFIVLTALLGLMVWRLLAPNQLWTSREGNPTEPIRLRQTLRLAAIVLTCITLGLILSGYILTAITLTTRILQSLAILLFFTILHALAARWFVLGERRLALKRMEEKQRDADENTETPVEERVEIAEPEEITLASVNAQTRHLLRVLTGIALVFAWLWAWGDVAPALSFLGNITAWDSSQLIDGKEVVSQVTLRSLLLAVVAFSLTWVATRNLPGLLEVGVLRKLNLDAATRYAVVAVCRYTLVFVGLIIAIGQLGVRWNHLQWLAAAFTVGLGFGLQEIFANFASGLIVLFERPFRVGDVVTIGNIEGTVMRIRTRATTLLDGDNKEVVVPNKIFITDRLTNWTLSDTVTRIVIKIGVAYSCNPKEVRQLLLEIAAGEANVLENPPPTCWFKEFGASTLDFELRVFVGDIEHRNRVRNALNERIIEVFRERNIDIAFPQLDVHVKEMPSSL